MLSNNDPELIEALSSNDSARRSRALNTLYESCYPKVETYIIGNSGSKPEARDIFQDAMVVLYDNICLGKFRGESKTETYLFSICRNLWLQQLRKKRRGDTFLEEMTLMSDMDEKTETLNVTLLEEVFGELKEDCRKILIGFYYKKKSIKELQKSFSAKTEQVIKNKKGRCLNYLMRIAKSRNLELNSFFSE